MVVDCHTHVVRYESFTAGYRTFLERYRPDYFDTFTAQYEHSRTVDAMLEAAGVDWAVVMAEPTPLTTGIASTEYVATFCGRGRRLIPFASFNPWTTPGLPEMVEDAVKRLGCRGLKMYPSYWHIWPGDPVLYPLYAKAQDLGIPVTFHTGSSVFPNAKMKFAEPLALDELAADFPRLQILMAHGGRPFWHEQAQFLARLHPNFYLELSGLPPKRLIQYFPELERIAAKTLFATDWPATPTSIQENIEQFSLLPLSDAAKHAILDANARRVLQL